MTTYHCPTCGAQSGEPPRFPSMDYVIDWDYDKAQHEYEAVEAAHRLDVAAWEAAWNEHFPCDFGVGEDFDMTPYHREGSNGSVSHPLSQYDHGWFGVDTRCQICMWYSK